MMKIVTLNTWGMSGPYETRWDYLLEELQRIQPDVICFQEVFEPTLVRKIEECFQFSGVASHEAGLVILTRFSISSHQDLKYQTKSPLEEYERHALSASLTTQSGPLLVVNTHLAWKPEDEKTRLNQVKELIAAVEKKESHALLAGDFNDTPESKPVKTIKAAGFIDLFESLHPDERGLTWDNKNPFMKEHAIKLPDRRIDFLFAHKKLLANTSPLKCEVVFNLPDKNGIYPSDHYGVVVDLET